MNYKTRTEKEQDCGQILCYRPYPAEVYKKRLRPHPISIILRIILIALVILSALVVTGKAEHMRRWVLCKPGDHVNLRMEPGEGERIVGYLECGDEFQTDGRSRNGWLRVLDAGECECWIYGGYVVDAKPEAVNENYVCVAKNRAACRRWVDGPKIAGRRGWLHNGTDVNVFYIAGEWALTNRGYIRAEWLEVCPL